METIYFRIQTDRISVKFPIIPKKDAIRLQGIVERVSIMDNCSQRYLKHVNSLEKKIITLLEELNFPVVLEEGNDDYIVITLDHFNNFKN
jgi:hypothetical protein